MPADFRELLERTAASPTTPVDPAQIASRSRRRTRRRRGGAGLTGVALVALIAAVAWPGLVPGDGLIIEDRVADQSEIPVLDLPEGWVQVQVGDAVFGIPGEFEIVEVDADDPLPCDNVGNRAYLATETYPSATRDAAGNEYACNAAGNAAPQLFAAPLSVVPAAHLGGDSWNPRSIGTLDGEWRLGKVAPPDDTGTDGDGADATDDALAERTAWYRIPAVDLHLRFVTTEADVDLVEAILATITPMSTTSDSSSPDTPVEDAAGPAAGELESLPGEAEKWELTGSSPDGRLLTLVTTGGGCSTFQGWVSHEDADRVHVEARWEHSGEEVCRAILLGDQLTLRLEQPLGDRQLTGCERDDCLAPPDDEEPAAPSNQVSVADDALVVTGTDTTWSIAPSDGTVRWERARDGYWSRAVDGRVLRYDHFDHIEMLDAVTGETRWEADDVTLAGIEGDEVVVCPREQALDHGPRAAFRGALSLDDGSWLWRDEGASCTTGAADGDEPEVPDVDLDPDRIGRSAAVDLTTRDGIVYVATSTAIIALDPNTGERLWWTLLVPSTAVDVGGTHSPTTDRP